MTVRRGADWDSPVDTHPRESTIGDTAGEQMSESQRIDLALESRQRPEHRTHRERGDRRSGSPGRRRRAATPEPFKGAAEEDTKKPRRFGETRTAGRIVTVYPPGAVAQALATARG